MPCARPCADLGRGFGVLGEQKLAADRAERRAKRHLAESLDALRAELLEPNLTAKEADWTEGQGGAKLWSSAKRLKLLANGPVVYRHFPTHEKMLS
jgi:hypothetical protein